MKKLLFLLATAMLMGCARRLESIGTSAEAQSAQMDSIELSLIEKAKGGDGEAYLKLADHYRNNRDFVGMVAMASLAQQFGSIERVEDYFASIPESDDFRIVTEAIAKIDEGNYDEAATMANKLISNDCAEGYTVQASIYLERGDTLHGLDLMEQGAAKGSTFAELLLCLPYVTGKELPDTARLKELAARVPVANSIIAKVFTGENDANLWNEQKAAYYFLQSYKHACLEKQYADWLLQYHSRGGELNVSDKDLQQLQALAGDGS